MKNTTKNKFTFQQKMQAVSGMLFLMNRSQELNLLIEWTGKKYKSRQGKKFLSIQNSYEERLEMVQNKLFLLRIRFPFHYWLARALHLISNELSVKSVF